MSSPKIKRALLSVSDKQGLAEFAQGLATAGVELYASGGTRRHLEGAGLTVQEVSSYTGFPEVMDGRLKTLHPRIHGGILCRHDRPDDMRVLAEHGIVSFELVVVNLYPFRETIAHPDATIEQAVEQIDIGGPTLLRGAAKNHAFVTVACEPSQYEIVLSAVVADGATTIDLRRQLAARAFAHTASYDATIAAHLAQQFDMPPDGVTHSSAGESDGDRLPGQLTLSLTRKTTLRYGENPHQPAALYVRSDAAGHALVRAEQLHGKELSYNNLLDLDSALSIARSLPAPGVAVLKHNNPCGAATAQTLGLAMALAWDGDPTSAFGSILGCNVPFDVAAAEFLVEPGRFVEAIVAPDFEPAAVEILTTRPTWKKNVRLIKVGIGDGARARLTLRQIDGGFLGQLADDLADQEAAWRVVTAMEPSAADWSNLRFAWAACRHVKSNAIVLARDQALVGVGAGQMSRIDAVDIAIRKAAQRATGAVLASDAFFPFADSIHRAAQAGVTGIIQPGGSRRDEEVIAAANQHQLPMVFTGQRHFRH